MTASDDARYAPAWASGAVKDNERQIDVVRLRAYRLTRLQAELVHHDYAAALLLDPINIRYATGSRNMSLWTAHTPARYCFVPACGKAILWDFHNCEHLSDGLETIAEVRPARAWYYFAGGPRVAWPVLVVGCRQRGQGFRRMGGQQKGWWRCDVAQVDDVDGDVDRHDRERGLAGRGVNVTAIDHEPEGRQRGGALARARGLSSRPRLRAVSRRTRSRRSPRP